MSPPHLLGVLLKRAERIAEDLQAEGYQRGDRDESAPMEHNPSNERALHFGIDERLLAA
jgi:hypothetical protein